MLNRNSVYIFSTIKSIHFSNLIINFFQGKYNIYFIVPEKDYENFDNLIGSTCKVVNENLIFHKIEFEKLINQLKISNRKKQIIKNRFGWYYQQFLKIMVMCTSEDNKFIIWDGDTIPLNSINFFSEKNQNIFISPYEYHDDYFKTNKKILCEYFINIKYSQIVQFSCIVTENVIHLKKLLKLNDASKHDYKRLIVEKIIKSMNFGDSISLFSEYELIGNIKLNSKNQIKKIPLLFFRDSITKFSPMKIKILKYLNFKTATFESDSKNKYFDEIKFYYHIIKFYWEYYKSCSLHRE